MARLCSLVSGPLDGAMIKEPPERDWGIKNIVVMPAGIRKRVRKSDGRCRVAIYIFNAATRHYDYVATDWCDQESCEDTTAVVSRHIETN